MAAPLTVPAGWDLIEPGDYALAALPVATTTILHPVVADPALDAWAADHAADVADPVVAYVYPARTIAEEERYCVACALEQGVILDERTVAVRASALAFDSDDHDAYASGRACCMCAAPLPGSENVPRRCNRAHFCPECDD